MTDPTAMARELLAAEWAKGGFHDFADAEGSYLAHCAIRAITEAHRLGRIEGFEEGLEASAKEADAEFERASESHRYAVAQDEHEWAHDSARATTAKAIAAAIRALKLEE